MSNDDCKKATKQLPVPIKTQNGNLEIIAMQCPHCQGIFGVDSTYLDEIDNFIHCPMCCMQIEVDEDNLLNRGETLVVTYMQRKR